jgi:enamine deaminase RidA (YjgF/YER057c/UK114 family)
VPLKRIQPEDMHCLPLCTHVVKARNSDYIAGQVPLDANGQIVGPGDMSAQTRPAFENLKTALASVDANFSNLARITVYATDPGYRPAIVAQADTLSTVIEGLYDPDAVAQGVPSVRWFLGYDADGAPQFCGLPAHHTCPHRMDCSRCGLFIGGQRAKLVHDNPSLLRVTAETPMTEVQRLLTDGQHEAAARALEAAKEIAAPVPPSVAFLANPAGLSDARLKQLAGLATDDARAQLKLVADDLIATLADHSGKDGRNVAVTALRTRLALVQGLIRRCNVQPDPPTATLGGRVRGPSYIKRWRDVHQHQVGFFATRRSRRSDSPVARCASKDPGGHRSERARPCALSSFHCWLASQAGSERGSVAAGTSGCAPHQLVDAYPCQDG